MSLGSRLVPQPWMSIVIGALWLVLAPAVTAGQALMAAFLGLVLPVLTRRFWPAPPRLSRPVAAVRLGLRVLADIVVANVQVAARVLGPESRLKPAFVEVPLDIEDAFVATVLGSIISLTPGTVTIEIDLRRRVLLVHALDVGDAPGLVRSIKARYEAPLREVFGC